MTLIEQLQDLLARLNESQEVVNYKQRTEAELAALQKMLKEMEAKKASLTAELAALRSNVEYEKRHLATYREEIAKLRKSLAA
jgi:chromosome segregation ATPase